MRITGPEELKAERIAAMGTELGEIYHALTNEMSWISLKWYQYCSLYGTKPERVDLLNKAAPLFFAVIEGALWEDILLHLCRLTDSPRSLGKPNLSVKRLPDLVQDSLFQTEIVTLVDTALASTAFARDWRNRRLAHSDLALAVMASADPLADASRASVNDALASLKIILRRMHQHYFGNDIDLDLLGEPGDADALLRVLADGVEAARARWQRFEEGNPSPDDWRGAPAI